MPLPESIPPLHADGGAQTFAVLCDGSPSASLLCDGEALPVNVGEPVLLPEGTAYPLTFPLLEGSEYTLYAAGYSAAFTVASQARRNAPPSPAPAAEFRCGGILLLRERAARFNAGLDLAERLYGYIEPDPVLLISANLPAQSAVEVSVWDSGGAVRAFTLYPSAGEAQAEGDAVLTPVYGAAPEGGYSYTFSCGGVTAEARTYADPSPFLETLARFSAFCSDAEAGYRLEYGELSELKATLSRMEERAADARLLYARELSALASEMEGAMSAFASVQSEEIEVVSPPLPDGDSGAKEAPPVYSPGVVPEREHIPAPPQSVKDVHIAKDAAPAQLTQTVVFGRWEAKDKTPGFIYIAVTAALFALSLLRFCRRKR